MMLNNIQAGKGEYENFIYSMQLNVINLYRVKYYVILFGRSV